MPPKTSLFKKTNRRYKKKAYGNKTYRKYGNKKTYGRVYTIPQIVTPKSKVVKMKMAFQLDVPTITTGTIDFDYINIASVHDPLATAGTRQPYGTAILFQQYTYATVLTCNVKLTCMSPYGDTAPFVMLLTLQDATGQLTSIDEVADFYETATRMKNCKIKQFGNFISKNLTGNNYIVGSYSAKKYYGNTSYLSNPNYASTSSTNPTIHPRMGIYITPAPGSTVTSGAVSFMMEFSYYVKWWSPIGIDND